MRKNSNQIGRAFENDVAKLLTRWYGVPGASFMRRPTVYENDGIMTGQRDIMHTRGIEWPYCVQCKKSDQFDLWQVAEGSGRFWGFWKETEDQAREYNMLPMLFVKTPRRPVLLVVRVKDRMQVGLAPAPHNLNPILTRGLCLVDAEAWSLGGRKHGT